MADLLEMLKGLGVDDKLLEAVASKIPSDKKLHLLEDGQFVPINRFNEVNEQKNTYKKQSEELNAQVSELGKFKGTAEELQKQVANVQVDYQKKLQELEQGFKIKQRDWAVNNALTNAKARNAKAVSALLDLTKIEVDGDNVKGLNEQLESIQKENPYLFEIQQTPPPSSVGRTQTPPNAQAPIDENLRKAFGLPPIK